MSCFLEFERIRICGLVAMVNRREFLWRSGGGLGGIALASMLAAEEGEVLPQHLRTDAGRLKRVLDRPCRAKRVVQLFMAGAASQIDLWDYKPILEKLHGKPSDFGEKVEAFQDGLGPWMKSPFRFRPYGDCGKWISDVVAPLGA